MNQVHEDVPDSCAVDDMLFPLILSQQSRTNCAINCSYDQRNRDLAMAFRSPGL